MSVPCRLYLITPPTIDDPASFARDFEAACEGGDVAALQVRLKDVPEAVIEAAVRALQPIADELGVELAQLAIAWCLLNPHVSTVMLGASKTEQLEKNLGALDVLPRIDKVLQKRIEQAVA